jgi:hypothetical protein
VHDDPAPTEDEKDQPERIAEEEAKAAPGHDDPRATEKTGEQ